MVIVIFCLPFLYSFLGINYLITQPYRILYGNPFNDTNRHCCILSERLHSHKAVLIALLCNYSI